MKKKLSVLLALVILVSALPVSVRAASGPNAPDLLYYAQEELTFEEESLSSGVYSRAFRSSEDCYEVLKAYVKLLQDKYDYKLTAEPYYVSYKNGKNVFFDFSLKYTGSGSIGSDTAEATFSKEEGHIVIYGTIDSGRVKGYIYYVSGIDRFKGTERYGKTDEEEMTVARIWKDTAAGKYMNSDKELQISAGEAKLSMDGKITTCTAYCVENQDSNQFQVHVQDKNQTEQVLFYFPLTVDLEPDNTFQEEYFIVDSDYAVSSGGCFQSMPQYTWSSMFAVNHDGEYVVPVRGMGGEMTDLQLRSAYDEDEDVYVFYAVARFETAPYEMKLMVAAKNRGTIIDEPDDTFFVSKGDSKTIKGPWKSSESYELWTWEILSGKDCIQLTDAKSRSCEIKGVKKGEARIRVTYEYTVEQADVLTGRAVNWEKSMTEEYVIYVK